MATLVASGVARLCPVSFSNQPRGPTQCHAKANGRKWQEEHAVVRKCLGAFSPSPPPARNCGCADGDTEDEEDLVDWDQFKPRREADIMRLISASGKAWRLPGATDPNPQSLFFFDVTEQASHGRYFAESTLPPFLTSHRIVVFSLIARE